MDNKFNLEYFIKKFSDIPEEKWTTGQFVDESGCMCAYGHCGDRKGQEDGKESKDLSRIIMDKDEVWPYHLADINDGNYDHEETYGNNPKDRVVNYLKSLRK